jgi:gamma-glutamylcyclotransferase (GGCT)/AIG2-like uncharacterized protein YtfP
VETYSLEYGYPICVEDSIRMQTECRRFDSPNTRALDSKHATLQGSDGSRPEQVVSAHAWEKIVAHYSLEEGHPILETKLL